jgi:hypothetical protein
MGHRFDVLAKAVAGGLSRRKALQHLAGGGVTAALLAAAGLGKTPAAAQPSAQITGMSPGCVVEFEATVRLGPSAGLTLRGRLAGVVDAAGHLSQGAFVLADGTRLPLVGQLNGRAINLLIQLSAGRNVYGVGTLENDLHLCSGSLGGVFSGPLAGDLGDWAAVVRIATITDGTSNTLMVAEQ